MTLEGTQNREASLVGSGGLKEVRAGLIWESVNPNLTVSEQQSEPEGGRKNVISGIPLLPGSSI